jgi:hypothetical protein
MLYGKSKIEENRIKKKRGFERNVLTKVNTLASVYNVSKMIRQKKKNTIISGDLFLWRLMRYVGRYKLERQYKAVNELVFKIFFNKFLQRQKLWKYYQNKTNKKVSKMIHKHMKERYNALGICLFLKKKGLKQMNYKENRKVKVLRAFNKKMCKFFFKRKWMHREAKLEKLFLKLLNKKIELKKKSKAKVRSFLVQKPFFKFHLCGKKELTSLLIHNELIRLTDTPQLREEIKKHKETLMWAAEGDKLVADIRKEQGQEVYKE